MNPASFVLPNDLLAYQSQTKKLYIVPFSTIDWTLVSISTDDSLAVSPRIQFNLDRDRMDLMGPTASFCRAMFG